MKVSYQINYPYKGDDIRVEVSVNEIGYLKDLDTPFITCLETIENVCREGEQIPITEENIQLVWDAIYTEESRSHEEYMREPELNPER